MNIQQLKCFVEVSKTLNFTKASQNLFISQTAVSNHIKHLEETLGFHLFIRNKKHVQLTQQGEIFLKNGISPMARREIVMPIQKETRIKACKKAPASGYTLYRY